MPLLELAVIKKVGVPLIAVALRVGAQVIYDRFRKGKDTSIINRLGRTMKSISPVRDRIGKLSNVEGKPFREVHESLTRLLEDAKSIIENYRKLRWSRHVCRKYRYIKKLESIELELVRVVLEIQVDQWTDIKEMKAIQVDQWTDIKETKAQISEMHNKLINI
uniref:HR4 n=1 Tax=Arabidopsis thaliana TaxID=3702 RepID=A0A514YL92_ARATH|nr:HR4 [Arabidopsis thaliana]